MQIAAAMPAEADIFTCNPQNNIPYRNIISDKSHYHTVCKFLRQTKFLLFLHIAEEAVMSDFHEPRRKYVHQEPPYKFYRSKRHDFFTVIILAVTPLEANHAVFTGYNPVVGNGYAMRIASQIIQ